MGTPGIAALQPALRHDVIDRSHPEYEAARSVWNRMVDRRPLLIARPSDAKEVAHAVLFAREHDLPLSVKGGGHGVAGRAICDDGLVIDLCHLREVKVDPVARTASVAGGATLRALDAGADLHGLVTTAGIYHQTGVAGLAMGGGVGVLMRRYGLTCDNLLAAEVVTGDGDIVVANEQSHPDLFWALRGGGGNFGVVTRMEFQLHPLTSVLGGSLDLAIADAPRLFLRYSETMADAPDDLQIYLNFASGEVRDGLMVEFCHVGSHEDGEAAIERLLGGVHPIAGKVGRKPYLAMQQHWDQSFPDGFLHYWKSSFLTSISEEVLWACREAIAAAPLPGCKIAIEPMGGAISRIAADVTAFSERHSAGTLLILNTWKEPAETDERIGWVRETFAALKRFSLPSAYINYFDLGDEDRTEAAFGANFTRLRRIKRTYDPTNLFQSNANIVP